MSSDHRLQAIITALKDENKKLQDENKKLQDEIKRKTIRLKKENYEEKKEDEKYVYPFPYFESEAEYLRWDALRPFG